MNEKPQLAKLAPEHDHAGFDCGSEPLNRHLKQHALQGQRAGSSQTYVAAVDMKVVGFHTLVVGDVTHEGAPERLSKGLPRYPIPVIILARLAVDNSWKGKGLGAALLVDAMRRVLNAADIAGVRAMAVHAKDDAAKAFYEHLGFLPFPGQISTLYRLLKDIRSMSKN